MLEDASTKLMETLEALLKDQETDVKSAAEDVLAMLYADFTFNEINVRPKKNQPAEEKAAGIRYSQEILSGSKVLSIEKLKEYLLNIPATGLTALGILLAPRPAGVVTPPAPAARGKTLSLDETEAILKAIGQKSSIGYNKRNDGPGFFVRLPSLFNEGKDTWQKIKGLEHVTLIMPYLKNFSEATPAMQERVYELFAAHPHLKR